MPDELSTRICRSCKVEKPLNTSNFRWRNDNQRFRTDCIECEKLYQQQYKEENKEKVLQRKKNYYWNNRDAILKYKLENKERDARKNKEYKKKNKEKIFIQHKEWVKKNPEKVKSINKRYAANNKEKIAAAARKYRQDNKEEYRARQRAKYYKKKNDLKFKESRRKRQIKRLKKDLIFKLRKNISRAINIALKGNKRGASILNYLSYTIEQLWKHLEVQFEPWMNKDNHGQYDPKIWNDNDSSTWKWQLDHIIPQSDLPYISMEDENFKKCWALENLRPLSAKQNLEDGALRTRHKIKKKA